VLEVPQLRTVELKLNDGIASCNDTFWLRDGENRTGWREIEERHGRDAREKSGRSLAERLGGFESG